MLPKVCKLFFVVKIIYICTYKNIEGYLGPVQGLFLLSYDLFACGIGSHVCT